MLKIHEATTASGALSPVFLRLESDTSARPRLAIVCDGETFALPDDALDAVMARYGAPLDPASSLISVDALDLGEGRSLRHVRHLARYDVIARDYVVYERAGADPLCALATTVAGALDHLGRAAARAASPSA
jgi:hypothetical protein